MSVLLSIADICGEVSALMPQALRPSIEMEQKPPQPNEDTFLVVAAFHLLPIVYYSLTFRKGAFSEVHQER